MLIQQTVGDAHLTAGPFKNSSIGKKSMYYPKLLRNGWLLFVCLCSITISLVPQQAGGAEAVGILDTLAPYNNTEGAKPYVKAFHEVPQFTGTTCIKNTECVITENTTLITTLKNDGYTCSTKSDECVITNWTTCTNDTETENNTCVITENITLIDTLRDDGYTCISQKTAQSARSACVIKKTERLIDSLYDKGYNTLILGVGWNNIKFKAMPWVPAGKSLTTDELHSLVKYANDNGITVVPEVKFLSKMERLTGTRWGVDGVTLLPGVNSGPFKLDEETYNPDPTNTAWGDLDHIAYNIYSALVYPVIDEIIQVFFEDTSQKFKAIHIGHDEVSGYGDGIQASMAVSYKKFVDDIMITYQYIRDKNLDIETWMWGDMLIESGLDDNNAAIDLSYVDVAHGKEKIGTIWPTTTLAPVEFKIGPADNPTITVSCNMYGCAARLELYKRLTAHNTQSMPDDFVVLDWQNKYGKNFTTKPEPENEEDQELAYASLKLLRWYNFNVIACTHENFDAIKSYRIYAPNHGARGVCAVSWQANSLSNILENSATDYAPPYIDPMSKISIDRDVLTGEGKIYGVKAYDDTGVTEYIVTPLSSCDVPDANLGRNGWKKFTSTDPVLQFSGVELPICVFVKDKEGNVSKPFTVDNTPPSNLKITLSSLKNSPNKFIDIGNSSYIAPYPLPESIWFNVSATDNNLYSYYFGSTHHGHYRQTDNTSNLNTDIKVSLENSPKQFYLHVQDYTRNIRRTNATLKYMISGISWTPLEGKKVKITITPAVAIHHYTVTTTKTVPKYPKLEERNAPYEFTLTYGSSGPKTVKISGCEISSSATSTCPIANTIPEITIQGQVY